MIIKFRNTETVIRNYELIRFPVVSFFTNIPKYTNLYIHITYAFNSNHGRLKFTFENENQNSINFDVIEKNNAITIK